MSFKTLIFFGLVAVALGFTLPEENAFDVEPNWVYGDVVPMTDDVVLVRKSRSPQNSVTGAFGYDPQSGSSATVEYNRQLAQNLEAYASASRNFKFNENSGQAGIRYWF